MADVRKQIIALKQWAAVLLETSQSQAEAFARHAQPLSDQATALNDEIAAERTKAADQRKRTMIASRLAQGMDVANSAQAAATEYFHTTGEPPASNQDAGLPLRGRR